MQYLVCICDRYMDQHCRTSQYKVVSIDNDTRRDHLVRVIVYFLNRRENFEGARSQDKFMLSGETWGVLAIDLPNYPSGIRINIFSDGILYEKHIGVVGKEIRISEILQPENMLVED